MNSCNGIEHIVGHPLNQTAGNRLSKPHKTLVPIINVVVCSSFLLLWISTHELSRLLLVLVWHSSRSTTVSGHTPSVWTPWTRYSVSVHSNCLRTVPHLPFPSRLILCHGGLEFSSLCWLIEAKGVACQSIVLAASCLHIQAPFQFIFENKQKHEFVFENCSFFCLHLSSGCYLKKSTVWHRSLASTSVNVEASP